MAAWRMCPAPPMLSLISETVIHMSKHKTAVGDPCPIYSMPLAHETRYHSMSHVAQNPQLLTAVLTQALIFLSFMFC